MLLMERSVERAPYMTAIFLEFLYFTIEHYYPPLREYIQEHVAKAAQSIVEKGVIRYTPQSGHRLFVFSCNHVRPARVTAIYSRRLLTEVLFDLLFCKQILSRNLSIPHPR